MNDELRRKLERTYFEVLWGDYAKEREFEKSRKHYREVVTAIVDEIERDHFIIANSTIEGWARADEMARMKRHLAEVQE